MAEISDKRLYMVTFPDDGSYPGSVHETSISRLKSLFAGMLSSGKNPLIETSGYAIYEDEEEAKREALRRLKLMRDVLDKEIGELEEELQELATE